ncbi:NAD-dependent epimerase/dehydratase family protein [Sphingopyxis sp.]|jgi:nucleoside-diphosphate-sugar epimerase|uniref:NAD-dependent epimerase/dehydratase family protein n=1 Tax=Sphingopyxis sp. TaxID=1908224 RepID=UPI003F71E396
MDDDNQRNPLIIVGGRSRSGRAVRTRLADWPMLGIVREAANPGECSIADYAEPPTDLDLRGARIIICAGAVNGTHDELWHANVDVPKAWARRGIEGGARHLIQISSFSIFGRAEAIGTDTPPAPVSHYGESKLGAEFALTELAREGLPITMLRVPILVGSGSDKLAKFVHAARRTGLVLSAPWPTPRSMLPYDGLACAVEAILQRPAPRDSQILFAADPEPFTARMMKETAKEYGRTLRTMHVPAYFLKMIEKTAPGLHASLFRPNLLDPDDNMLADGEGFVRLRTTLRAMLRD